MSNVFTETTTTSWFSRMKNALVGVLVGLMLVPGSMVLLFWNESRAIRETYRLNEGESNVVEDVPIDSVQPDLEGKLVHVTGMVHALTPVMDPVFGLEQSGIKLKRSVQMYQWKEEEDTKREKQLGGSEKRVTTYSYVKGWHDERVASEDFKQPESYVNPALPYEEKIVTTEGAELGAFQFPERLLSSINNWKSIPLDDEWLGQQPEEFREHALVLDNTVYFRPNGVPDKEVPEIGDIRMEFKVVPDSDVTLVSAQHEDSFRAYPTKYGGLELMNMGKLSAGEVFERAHTANTFWTWGLRLAGFVVMGIAFCMIMKPLTTFAGVIPFLENLAGFAVFIIGFGLAGVLSAITIAIAWIAVRPILGISLLVVAGALIVGLYFFRSGQAQQAKDHHGVELM